MRRTDGALLGDEELADVAPDMLEVGHREARAAVEPIEVRRNMPRQVEVADGVEFYARGMFSQSVIRSIIAPSGVFGNALTVPGNNPYLPASVRDQICTLDGIALGATCSGNAAIPLPGVYRRLVELGPRIGNYENNVYDARVGLKIDITKSINSQIEAFALARHIPVIDLFKASDVLTPLYPWTFGGHTFDTAFAGNGFDILTQPEGIISNAISIALATRP